MPQRFLRPGITTSDSWNRVSFPAQSLFIRLLTLVDDYGRYEANPHLIRGHAFALRLDITVKKIEAMCDELGNAGLAQFYEVGGKRYVQITNWQERARTVSKYPAMGEEARLDRPLGNVYFILSEKAKRVKIGFTAYSVDSRLNTLQTGSAERLVVLYSFQGSAQQERELHRKFKAYNVGGEWFSYSPEIAQFVSDKTSAACCAQPPALCVPPSPSSSPSSSSPPTSNASGAHGSKKPARGNTDVDDAEWKRGLMQDVAYRHINIPAEFSKWQRWCARKKKKPTQGRFEAWLNNIEPPVVVHAAMRTVKPPKVLPDPEPELSDEQRERNRVEFAKISESLRTGMRIEA